MRQFQDVQPDENRAQVHPQSSDRVEDVREKVALRLKKKPISLRGVEVQVFQERSARQDDTDFEAIARGEQD
ncbi:unnamed protein product [Nesidiocoris tenuis]|uniref:Uncharacterized protein n=1 Tax=Nesidiocoris tenuis TaxID=355587 RepID=A0A6H5H7U8_9HEMI|nr:unnamed protein product [Nesidiocoris tenuis]